MIKHTFFLVIALVLLRGSVFAQNILVNNSAFSDQELIQDVLFETDCVDNIIVNNVVSGNFSNSDSSYGYFNANNSGFPFEEGLVLTTGRLSNVPGPNNSLSDDNAPGWIGDQDLENALGITNTLNATIFEFSFVAQVDNINFRYLFASEEYRENEPTTCQFSDAFAFLIRPAGGQYQNLAVIPGTNTPVQVTTVRPEIPGACEALNEEFFGQFNDTDSPINFNGQTAILTAETSLNVGQTYEVKLVIADETNFRYDSAVFIEANSFNLGVDLGENQILCDGEILTLQVENDEAVSISWFLDGQPLNNPSDTLQITQDNFGSGNYSVEVEFPSGCSVQDDIDIFFEDISLPDNLSISTCVDEDGFGIFNLLNIQDAIDSSLQINGFFSTLSDAEQNINPIQNPESYDNTAAGSLLFFSVTGPGNCSATGEIMLTGQTDLLEQVTSTVCPAQETSPTSFTLQSLLNQVGEAFGVNSGNVDLFYSENEAINQMNEITSGFLEIETELLPLTIFARINSDTSCGIAPVLLQKLDAPQFVSEQSDFLICENEGNSIVLSAEVQDAEGEILYEWSTGESTAEIIITEPGTYTVDVFRIQEIDGQEIICTNAKTFNVVASSVADVSYTQTGFVGEDNQLIINAEGSGDYEYALNDSAFVDTNIFQISETENIFAVRDKNGCGVINVEFVALRIPGFFTPNGDGFNDYWQIEGLRQSQNDVKTIYIFDRYGKLIFESSPLLIGWDGTYKGVPAPQQDYWYKILLNSGRSLSGHFTLKR